MADRYDELHRLREQANAKTAEQVVQQIGCEYQAASELAWEAAAKADWQTAAYHARECKKLEQEAAPYVQAAQQQQPQSQYSRAELDLMQHYPDQVRKNWNTAKTAANNLIASKMKADPEADLWAYRNSPEYIGTIAHACGILDANFAESNETTSANEALRACQSKYGEVSASEYNENVKRLAELKKYGLYPMGQT
jgi:hypothetical protein